MSDSQLKTIDLFCSSINQPALTAAINTALRLGLIDALRSGQKTSEELARICGIHHHAVPALMCLLKNVGIVEQFAEYYALSQAAQLAPQSLWAILFDQWTHLEAALRCDPETPATEFERLQTAERNRQQFMTSRAMRQWTSTPAAIKAAEALDIADQRRSLHILDLGCGAAVYSMTLAHRDTGCIVRLVDDASGLVRARATVENLELEARVSFVQRDDLNITGHDGAFDLVIFGDHIHFWTPDELLALLTTAHRVLGPGGELAVIDVFPGQERGIQAFSEFQLQALIGTGNALVTPEQLSDLMTQVGFSQIQFTHLPAPPWTHGLMLGTRE